MTPLQFVPAAQWQPPPPAAVFGELSQDGSTVILIVQGGAGDMQTAGTRLSALTPAVRIVDKGNDVLSVPCTWPAVTQLSASFPGTYGSPRWVPGPRLCEWIIAELTRRTALPDRTAYPELPPGIMPRPYQDAAAAALAQVGRFLIFDEPGLGKTAETLLGLEWRRRLGHAIFPCLVIVPSWDVADGWAREIARWMPGWRPPVMHGGPGRLERLGTADTYLTTYATARRDAPDITSPLCRLRPASVVIDEIHFLANQSAHQTKAAQRLALHAGTVAGLTGTPVTTDTGNVWGALNAVDPASWPARERYVKRFCETRPGQLYGEGITGLKPLAAPELFACLTGAMRRVTKKQVLPQLPDKIHSVRRVKMPPEWRAAYDGMVDDMIACLPDGQELSTMDTIAQFTFLSQLACAAADVEITEDEEPDPVTGIRKKHYHAVLRRPSWKCDALLEILAERKGQPVVAFMPSRQLAMIAGEMAAEAGRRVGYIVGLEKGVTRKSRQADIAAFAAGELDLICATTGAGGTGIDGLQVAGTSVFLQRPSLGKSVQAEDRCMTAGTPVLTPDGWKPIEDIITGDLVITRTGAAQPVTDTWSRFARNGTVMAEIGITGQEPVTCTSDHPFLLQDGTWRDAGDLKPGDWLAMPGNDVTAELAALPFEGARIADTFENAWGSTQQNGRLRHAPDVIKITDDFLYVLGYFAGDGFSSTGSDKGRFISFAGNTGRKAAALDRCERWAASAGLRGARRQKAGSRGTEQRFYSGEWAYWFRGAFGHGARNKRLPGFALRLNARQSQLVLDGLNASDGYKRDSRPRREYSTMSRQLAANVLQLATRAGYRPSLANGSTGQLIIAFGGTHNPSNSPGRVRSVLLRYCGRAGTERQERIYDITVKENATFTAGGVIVHNTHRIGSEIHARGVEIIDVIAENTVDDRLRERIREIGGQMGEFLRDPSFVRELLGGLR